MSDGSHPREVVFDNLRSGLTTDSMLERELAALRVSWIAWDSGFRGSGLQIGDEIIAVNGETIPRPTELRELQRLAFRDPSIRISSEPRPIIEPLRCVTSFL